jgi:hypothetical protein
MNLLLGIAAMLCFAATNVEVAAVERTINQTLSVGPADPYELLGTARGTYLNGYGALFTVELDLINAGPLSPNPFKPKVSPQELSSVHERKVKNLAILKDSMRTLMMNAGSTLDGMPPNERVSMEAYLFYYSWENSKGMPQRVLMSAEKQKLMDAKAAHAGPQELAAIIEEQDQ